MYEGILMHEEIDISSIMWCSEQAEPLLLRAFLPLFQG